jgi:hypothetical protein
VVLRGRGGELGVVKLGVVCGRREEGERRKRKKGRTNTPRPKFIESGERRLEGERGVRAVWVCASC